MSLFDALVDEQNAVQRGDLCSVARIKTHLGEEQSADLERAMQERHGGVYLITGSAIARGLNKLLGGDAFGIKGPTVMRHRRGACECS